MARCRFGLIFAVGAWLLFGCGAPAVALELGIERPARWISSSQLTYDLLEVDDLGDPTSYPYGYCRWGTVMDEATQDDALDFTALTKGPFDWRNKDLFVVSGTAAGERMRLTWNGQTFPAGALWKPKTGNGGEVRLNQGSAPAALMRYLHFRSWLNDSRTLEPIDERSKKLVILIHGWNRESDGNGFSGNAWVDLHDTLSELVQLRPGWQLAKYHWEADADTGYFPLLWESGDQDVVDFYRYATEAAEIGRLHGCHLGELLSELCPDLERVQFIAHSAGAWVARTAAKCLLQQNKRVVVQVTLLDPFIPGRENWSSIPDSALDESQINELDGLVPSNDRRLFLLENYYAEDGTDLVWGSTSGAFAWYRPNIQQWVDFWMGDYPIPIYKNHSGPIQFYADLAGVSLGHSPGDLLYAPYDWSEMGWGQSLCWKEPLLPRIATQPEDFVGQSGQSATLTVGVSGTGAVSYRWFRNDDQIPSETNASLTVTLGSDTVGQYYARLDNSEGPTFSRLAKLRISDGGAPVIVQEPQDSLRQAGQTATFSLTAAGGTPLTYQWARSDRFSLPGETNSVYTSESLTTNANGVGVWVDVSNPYGTVRSRAARLTVSPAGTAPADADPYEPNDSSRGATPLVFGATVNPRISHPADVDWFELSVQTAGIVTLSLTVPSPNDYDLELYGPDGDWVAGSYGGIGIPESITFSASTTGSYWLRVYGYPVGTGSYNTSTPYSLRAVFASAAIDIAAQPQDASVPWGAAATFSVSASSGTGLLRYQWQRNGADIPGAVGPAYTTTETDLSDDGDRYSVRVWNGFDSVISGTGTLHVTDSPSIWWTGAVSDNWNNTNNWDLGRLPGGGDVVRIDSGHVDITTSVGCGYLISEAPVYLRPGGSLYGNIASRDRLDWSGGTLGGAVAVAPGAQLNILGNGSKRLGANATLNNSGSVVWGGTGSVECCTNVINNLAGATFEIQGDAAMAHWMGWWNYGSLHYRDSVFNNQGLFRKTGAGGATLFSNAGANWIFNNSGIVELLSGTLNFASTWTQITGNVALLGGKISGATIRMDGGGLSGFGRVECPVNNVAGRVAPDAASGGLVFASTFQQGAAGSIELDVAGTEAGTGFDQITILGAATLGGTLRLVRDDGFTPQLAATLQLMLTTNRTSGFATVIQEGPPDDVMFSTEWNTQGLLATAVMTGHRQWELAKFGGSADDPHVAGNGADPDGDDMPNLLEYFLGREPMLPDRGGLPLCSLVRNPGDGKDYLCMTIQFPGDRTDVAFRVDVSSDLKTWHSGDGYTTTVSDATANGIRTVIVRDATPMNQTLHRFLRLVLEE